MFPSGLYTLETDSFALLNGKEKEILVYDFETLEYKESFPIGENISGNNTLENSDFALFQIIFNHNDSVQYIPAGFGDARILHLIYNKQTGKSSFLQYFHTIKSCAFENDLDFGAPFKATCTNNSKLYQIMDAITFMTIAEKSNSLKMKEVASTLT